jgi:hypothetical protein
MFFRRNRPENSLAGYDTAHRTVVPEPARVSRRFGCAKKRLVAMPGIPSLNVTGDVARLKNIPRINEI